MSADRPDPSQEDFRAVLAELRQRRVGRVAAAYLASAVALLEVAAATLPGGGSLEGGFRPVLGAVVLGFPIAIVLAWRYDVNAGRIERTPDDLTDPEPTPTGGRGWLIWTLTALAIAAATEWLRTR